MKRGRVDLRGITSAQAQAAFGVLSLVALLLYTWKHTGSLLAHYVHPAGIGYVCAFGIELAIVSLSLRIGQERRNGATGAGFLVVLVAVLVVSAFANVAEGYATAYGTTLTLRSMAGIDPLQAVIGIAATGLISVIVFALADIIGMDVRKAAQAAERADARERKAQAAAPEPVAETPQAVTQVAAPPQAAPVVLRLPEPAAPTYVCRCGQPFAKQQGLAAHMRHCAQAKQEKVA